MSNFTIAGHEFQGGGTVMGDTTVGFEIHQNFRTADYVLVISREVGRSGDNAVWEVTDVASLQAEPGDGLSQVCKVGGAFNSNLIGVYREAGRVLSRGEEGEPYYAAVDAVEVIDGIAMPPRVSGTGVASMGIGVSCADEGWGV